MATRELQYLSNNLILRSHRIYESFQTTDHFQTATCCPTTHKRTRALCVIDLHNAWSQFCKDLVFVSALGGCRTRSGILLQKSPLLLASNDILGSLRATYARPKPHYWEPRWSIATEVIDACTRLGITNLSNVSAAIGSTTSVAEELRHTRNYVSHRKADTALKAINALPMHGAVSPLDIDSLLTSYVNSGVTLFEHWVSSLSITSIAACD